MKIYCNLHLFTFEYPSFIRATKKNKEYLTPLGLKKGNYVFEYDYPLSRTAHSTHKLDAMTTGADILKFGKEDYERIYKEEEEGTSIQSGMIPGMLNRNRTDGPWGIWGHVISDLFFEGIDIDEKKKTVSFYIGS